MPAEPFFTFLPDGVSFSSKQAAGIKTIYAPLCAPDSLGIKSAISPFLSGDIKIDKFHYLTKPVSREDLRYPGRAFFVCLPGREVISLFQESAAEEASVVVGPLWHKLVQRHSKAGIEISAVNFVPVSGEPVELMRVTIKNISKKSIRLTPTAAIALFGRSLANKHDHEHVTSLLNRPRQVKQGVLLSTTMAFNEEGHKKSRMVYFVYGTGPGPAAPAGSFPTAESFYGEQGSMLRPQAVYENFEPGLLKAEALNGKEAVGALRFKEADLKPGQELSYIVAVGCAADEAQTREIFDRFNTDEKYAHALEVNQKFWSQKISSISFDLKDGHYNAWMKWVTLQPVLRRIFGCSFLPDHDYGKGGRGWRDIWQDLLSLILIEPNHVRPHLINNCAGIRIDGSNATIIGSGPGEFLADRNAITRVWMDHGAWPLLTILLYIDQSGDYDILLHKQHYFRDPQLSRTHEKDIGWVTQYGHKLLDKKGHIYEGSILEHLLVTHLTQFFNVGEHNIIRLESADWNDGLDMAHEKGESAAFTSFYAGNLLSLADLVEDLARARGIEKFRFLRELLILLDTLGDQIHYDDPKAKRNHLFGKYFHHVEPVISGETVEVAVKDLVHDLRTKGHWIFSHLRQHEKIQLEHKGKKYAWYNGYYDNEARRVEGLIEGRVRMTLTGQVFAIMSGMASPEEVEQIILSADEFLKDKKLGGFRLNTDFGLDHYLELGRAFGFAYGTKENGAFFSHMNVMYAAALYQRGFARAGYRVLQSIYRMAVDGARSKIYPGIPEYFDAEGRGMYHYLTGSASWLVLTKLIHVFGVRGHRGDLILSPQLVKEEFNAKGHAAVICQFAGRRLDITYHNPSRLDAGQYAIKGISVDGKPWPHQLLTPGQALIQRSSLPKGGPILVLLGR